MMTNDPEKEQRVPVPEGEGGHPGIIVLVDEDDGYPD
jgi:hypothetical protein